MDVALMTEYFYRKLENVNRTDNKLRRSEKMKSMIVQTYSIDNESISIQFFNAELIIKYRDGVIKLSKEAISAITQEVINSHLNRKDFNFDVLKEY